MNKHTPGPWKWTWPEGELDPPQLEGTNMYADQNPILVTHGCSPSCMRKHGRPCPLTPSKPDMALIAAAYAELRPLSEAAGEGCTAPRQLLK